MRIAYIISVYKYPEQLLRLLRRLETSSSSFVIHVDRNTANPVYQRMRHAAEAVSNVHFLERHSCYWGGFGHVRATLKGIDYLLRTDARFDYAVLLTGQDYPLRPTAAIERLLEAAEGRSFLEWSPLPLARWSGHGGLDRIEHWHLKWRRVYIDLPIRRSIPGGLQPFGGGSYWCLSRRLVEHVHDFVRAKPSFVRFFTHVAIPDEIFFQTIIMNSNLRDSVVNDSMRYIDWTGTPAPAILRKADFDALVTSTKLFARKFDTTVDHEILDMLDQHIEQRNFAQGVA